MRFEPWIGFRYLVSKRSSVFVTVVSLMTVLGVVLGVAALNVTIAVMSGFEEDLKAKIIGMNAHAVVLSNIGTFTPDPKIEDQIRSFPGVTALSPFTYNELLMQSGTKVTGVIVKGADPKTVGSVTDLVRDICLPDEPGKKCGEHRDERMDERQAVMNKVAEEYDIGGGKKVFGLLLGQELAETMGVKDGGTIHLVAPSVGLGGAGPKVRTFKVVGTFRTGMWEYDQKFSFTSIEGAQKLSGDTGKIAGYELETASLYRAPKISRELEQDLGGYPWLLKSWQDLNGALFDALKLEKFVMGLLLSIITIVASFSIISILTLIVLEKAKEIAILKSMGAKDAMILGIFATEGFTIGTSGVAIGTLVGWLFGMGLKRYGFPLNVNVYYLDTVPVNLDWQNFLVVGLAGLAITFAATLLPSLVAARQNPVEGLAYE